MFGEHASFIIPAYGITFLVLAAMILRIRLAHKSHIAELDILEKSGTSRRSAKKAIKSRD